MNSNPAFRMDEEYEYENISHTPKVRSDERVPVVSRKKLVVGCVVASVICLIVGYGTGFGSAFAIPSATTTVAATVTEFEMLAEGAPIRDTVLSNTTVTTHGQCASLCRQQARCDGFGLDHSLQGGRACTLYDKGDLTATYLRHQLGTSYFARTDNYRPVFLYYPVLLKLNWAAARNNCRHIDSRARLVDVKTAEENYILFDLTEDFPGDPYMFKAVFTSGALVNGTWTWMSTGQPVRYTAWFPGEPNNADDIEDRIEIACKHHKANRKAHWYDSRANATLCSLCKVALWAMSPAT